MRLALYIRQNKPEGVQWVPKKLQNRSHSTQTETLADTANKKWYVNVGG